MWGRVGNVRFEGGIGGGGPACERPVGESAFLMLRPRMGTGPGPGAAGPPIEALGEGVQGLAIGDRVVFDTTAYVKVSENRRTGTWQQLVACDSKTVAKVRVPVEAGVVTVPTLTRM